MKLYTYWRSSAAYRVRIALELKGVAREDVLVHLVRNGGEHRTADYAALNPQRLVPTLVLDDGTVLTQSLAIIGYLEAVAPDPPLLPADPVARAQVQAVAMTVACDLHPVNNLRVLNGLSDRFGADQEARADWARHWIADGLAAVEALLTRAGSEGPWCFGAAPGLADVCLIPQLYNARRVGADLTQYPVIRRADAAAQTHPAFQRAAPEAQPDAG